MLIKLFKEPLEPALFASYECLIELILAKSVPLLEAFSPFAVGTGFYFLPGLGIAGTTHGLVTLKALLSFNE